jgi:hypothetical protein
MQVTLHCQVTLLVCNKLAIALFTYSTVPLLIHYSSNAILIAQVTLYVPVFYNAIYSYGYLLQTHPNSSFALSRPSGRVRSHMQLDIAYDAIFNIITAAYMQLRTSQSRLLCRAVCAHPSLSFTCPCPC